MNDETRPYDSNKAGGKEILDNKIVSTLRSTAKHVIK